MTYGFETLAIHAGQEPEARTGAVIPPIYQTSTYAQDATLDGGVAPKPITSVTVPVKVMTTFD